VLNSGLLAAPLQRSTSAALPSTCPDHVRRIVAREVRGGERLHHGRHFVAVDAQPGQRRGGDGLERGNFGRGCRRGGTRGSGRGHTPGGGRASGCNGWSCPSNRRWPRGCHLYFGQGLGHLPPGRFRQHQHADGDGLRQPTTSRTKPRPTSATPTTHGTAPTNIRSQLSDIL
jgi:hypothetical protein